MIFVSVSGEVHRRLLPKAYRPACPRLSSHPSSGPCPPTPPSGTCPPLLQTRERAKTLAEAMRAQGHAPSVITGSKDLPMEERVRLQEEFEKGVTKVLICTDLMTRGIDVPGMKLVVNFDLPYDYSQGFRGPRMPSFENFQHRSGRVGRFGKVGVNLHMVTNGTEMEVLLAMTNHFALTPHPLPLDNPEEASVMVEGAMEKPWTAAGPPTA